MKNKCIDCRKQITKYAKRCKKCSKTGKLNSHYKHGKCAKGYQNCCINCGKKIIWNSKRCRFCAEKKEQLKQKKGGYKHGKYCQDYHVYCKDCGKEITKQAKRCRKCWSIYHGKRIRGKKNPAYTNGLTHLPYPLEFKKIRKSIRKRDNYTCQNPKCNYTQKENKRALDIHHIDWNRFNCKEENLITLCNKCNVKANYNRDYWYAYYKYIMENNVYV